MIKPVGRRNLDPGEPGRKPDGPQHAIEQHHVIVTVARHVALLVDLLQKPNRRYDIFSIDWIANVKDAAPDEVQHPLNLSGQVIVPQPSK